MKSNKNKAMQYLKNEFGIIKNVIDVKNNFYDAKPVFIPHKLTAGRGTFVSKVRIDNFFLWYEQKSPSNQAGESKEGVYPVFYEIVTNPS